MLAVAVSRMCVVIVFPDAQALACRRTAAPLCHFRIRLIREARLTPLDGFRAGFVSPGYGEPQRAPALFALLAPLLYFDLAVALFRALEHFRGTHGLAPVPQQGGEAANEDGGDDDQCDDELGHDVAL